MLLPELRERVLDANLELDRKGLVLYTFGNASGIDRERGLVAIKPSGVAYEFLKAEDLVIVDSDLKTHLLLYREFPTVGGVVHTHSEFATGWAQAGTAIPCYGTTHADYFYGEIPVTRPLTDEEIEEDYEYNTGVVIVGRFKDEEPALDLLAVPGVTTRTRFFNIRFCISPPTLAT